LDFHVFKQDSALAHRACEMVEFLDRETPGFMSPCCWHDEHFSSANHRSSTATDSTNWD